MSVLFGGLNTHWCRHFMRACLDVILYALNNVSLRGAMFDNNMLFAMLLLSTWAGPGQLNGSTHNPVVGSHFPLHTILCLKYTRTLSLSYNTLQPASHSILMDTNDVCANPGTMFAERACSGSHGASKLHVCVDRRVCPSGKLSLTDCLLVGRL